MDFNETFRIYQKWANLQLIRFPYIYSDHYLEIILELLNWSVQTYKVMNRISWNFPNLLEMCQITNDWVCPTGCNCTVYGATEAQRRQALVLYNTFIFYRKVRGAGPPAKKVGGPRPPPPASLFLHLCHCMVQLHFGEPNYTDGTSHIA